MTAKIDFLKAIASEAQAKRSITVGTEMPESEKTDDLGLSPPDDQFTTKEFQPPTNGSPSSVPHLQPFADMDYWALTTPLRWASQDTLPAEVIVPQGFVTDFASIPSLFWSWMPKTGRYGLPAVVHDWLYWEQAVTRQQADDVFDAALGVLEVPMWQRFAIYRSVRWFGGEFWDDNTNEKSTGLRRVVTKFPEDPRISWEQWRQTPSNFT